MDLFDRVNALTDDQLQMVAERDDASGVLAAYRLAELRGLPYPDREAAILGDGYVIVAQGGQIRKVPFESVEKIIREESGEYCVYSEDGSRSFGCYPTMEDAENRLRQIHIFRNALREGSFVSWNSSGGRARGQIEHIMYEGTLGVPGSDFAIDAEEGDPAVLIRIWRQGSEGWAATETLVGHKMSTLTSIQSLKKESFVPPAGVQEAAQRALDWIAEGHAGSGFTDVGRARAAQLARGDAVSETTIRRMNSYLARHRNDSQAEGFNAGEEGFPSPGRVAWDAWGGDPAVSWVERIMGQITDDKQYDPDKVLTPRQKLMYDKYEWIADAFGPWDGGITGEGAHYIPAEDNVFADSGIKCSNCVFFEGGGGCEILDMAVEPDGACKLWIIPDDRVQGTVESTKSLSRDGRFLRKQASQRFTLGPLYVPDFMDAHGEWTDSEELQQAVWKWVQSGDRTIYLQHDREVRAGEWVEVMTMPQPWSVEMLNGQGDAIGKITYPKGTVFLGVIWDDGPWKQILGGELRGYSIGGFSDRVLADLPEEAARDGVEMDG